MDRGACVRTSRVNMDSIDDFSVVFPLNLGASSWRNSSPFTSSFHFPSFSYLLCWPCSRPGCKFWPWTRFLETVGLAFRSISRKLVLVPIGSDEDPGKTRNSAVKLVEHICVCFCNHSEKKKYTRAALYWVPKTKKIKKYLQQVFWMRL